MKKLKKILVTGGAGYVGAVLIPKLLDKGYQVTVVDWYLYHETVFEKHKKNRRLKEVKGDIRDRKLLEKELNGVDAVIHLACISNDPSFELDPDLGKSINYDATLLLTDISKKSGVKRFIYASSSSVYGPKEEEQVHEELPLAPLTGYSKYKVMSEEYIIEEGSKNFTVLILRPATICGYSGRLRLDLIVNMLTLQALVNKKITVFGGNQKRPNIHIEDMADLYVKSLEYSDEKIAKKVFNAGHQNYTLSAIAEMVRKVIGDKAIKIAYIPTDDLRSYHISSKKIGEELGYKPTHSVEEAIGDLVLAYRKGLMIKPIDNIAYYNVKMMKQKKIR